MAEGQNFEVEEVLWIGPRRPTPNLPQAIYQRPVEIGSYSTDHNRTFLHDQSELRYYVAPPRQHPPHPLYNGKVELDLTVGMEVGIIPHGGERLDTILQWILLNRDSIKTVDFICWRGLLTKVMMTPFFWSKKSSWKIAAVGFQGKIYMCQMATEEDLNTNQTPQQIRRATFPGFKFEQYVTSDLPDGIPNTAVPVNINKAFFSVVKSSLNEHDLLYSGEVDCVGEDNSYIELKTCKEFTSHQKRMNFKRYILPRAWAQSYLIGADHIVYGFKDKDLVVRRLETFQTSQIPEYCADIKDWTPEVALNFCDRFLKYVRNTVRDNSNRFVYVFDRRPSKGRITWRKEEVLNSEYSFLPAWYTNATMDQ